jgi:hypothetical protein
MNGFVECHSTKINVEALSTPRERGVVGSLEISVHQRMNRPQSSHPNLESAVNGY